MTKKAKRMSWAAFGMVALGLDIAVVLSVAPLAMDAVQRGEVRTALSASTGAMQAVTSVARERLTNWAGDGLVAAAKGAARAYGAMLRVTPHLDQVDGRDLERHECGTRERPASVRVIRVESQRRRPARRELSEVVPTYGPHVSFGHTL